MPEPTTPMPTDNGGTAQSTPTGTPPPQPAPAKSPAVAPTEPYRAFATQGDLDGFVQERVKRAERSALKKLATELGFEDADELKDALQPLRRGQGGGQSVQPGTPDAITPTNAPAAPSQDAARLMMALQVGAELNLPAALIARLQGDTLEAMKADAQTLVALMGTGTQRGPGIPPVPGGGQPVTITRTQLSDPKWVREHAEEIRQASAEGRIVRS